MSPVLILAWLARHGTAARWLAVAAVSAAVLAGAYASGHRAGVAGERPKVEAAEAQARTAVAQGAVTADAARAADTAAVRSTRILVQAEEAAHDVQTASGASEALDPDLLARWRSGLGGLRGEAAPGPDRAGGAEPAQSLPRRGG